MQNCSNKPRTPGLLRGTTILHGGPGCAELLLCCEASCAQTHHTRAFPILSWSSLTREPTSQYLARLQTGSRSMSQLLLTVLYRSLAVSVMPLELSCLRRSRTTSTLTDFTPINNQSPSLRPASRPPSTGASGPPWGSQLGCSSAAPLQARASPSATIASHRRWVSR